MSIKYIFDEITGSIYSLAHFLLNIIVEDKKGKYLS
jgi:hypothetical protein